MIKRLLLSNWRSHKHSELEFVRGTNILVGIMGSGKTSVIDAVCFALFGTFPKLSRKDAKLQDVLRRDTQDGEVSLEFDAGGNEYRVRRVFGTKSDAEVYLGGRLVEKTPKAATKYIEEALGIDYDLFSRAIYSEQNRMDYFLSLDPKRRKEEIDGLLGLDRFESARAGAQTASTKVRAVREAIEKAEPAKRAEESKARIGEFEKQADETRERKALEEKKLVEVSGKLKIAKAGLEALEAKDSAARKLESELASARKSCTMLEREIFELGALAGEYSEEEEKNARLQSQKARETHASLQKNLSGLVEKAAGMRERISTAKKSEGAFKEAEAKLKGLGKPEELSSTLLKISAEIEAAEAKRALASARRAEAISAAAILKEGGGKCPVCESELGPEKCSHLRKARQEDAEKFAGEERAFSQRLLALSKEKKGLEAREKDARSLLQILEGERENAMALPELEKQFGGLSSQKDAAEKEFAQADSESKKLGERLASLEASKKAASSLGKRKAELEEEKVRVEKLESEFAKTRIEPQSLLLARNVHSELALNEKTSRTVLEYLSQISSRISSELGAEKVRHAQYLSAMEEASGLLGAEERLAIYKNCLAQSQYALRTELVWAINSALSSLWGSVYPYADITAARLNAGEKDYVFEVQAAGDWRDIDAVASGGERACLCLALRIAFATVLVPKLSWLVLDEPTHNLDTEATLMLRSTLEERIPSIVEQTIVITHEQALVDADAKVYCLLRDKGKNEATKIVPAGSL